MTRKERVRLILKDAIKDFRLPPYSKNCVSSNVGGFCEYIRCHPLMKRCNYQLYVDRICNVDQNLGYWFANGHSQHCTWGYFELSYLKFERSDFAKKRLKELKNE